MHTAPIVNAPDSAMVCYCANVSKGRILRAIEDGNRTVEQLRRAARKFFIELLQKAAAAGEIDASLDLNAMSIWLYAVGDGLIIRVADDPEFDFQARLPVFATLVRRALRR